MASLVAAEEQSASKRPKDTLFKQQKLPAWQPIMTAGTVLPVLFVIGAIFIPLGIGLLVTSNNLQEITVDYTENCKPPNNVFRTCADYIQNKTGETCNCTIAFELKHAFRGHVHMYYSLTNFYQNHRRYVKSRDDNQLLGEATSYKSLTSDCEPFKGTANSSFEGGGIAYAPCGAIANSLFNDTLNITYQSPDGEDKQVGLIKTGIAWTTDKSAKFGNPKGFQADNPSFAFNNSMKPPNWKKAVYELDNEDPSNNGYENEDLIVWMRTAALPSFRKLYRHVDHSVEPFRDGLPAGNYTLHINYAYPTASFNGAKRMILSTTSWLGGKNPFLGIAYIVVGSICIVLGCIFLVIHIKIGKTADELSQNVNNQMNY